MTLDALRTACMDAFAKRAEAMTNAAINILPQGGLSADQYAMLQVDRLAQARVYMECQKIITDEYRKLTQPPDAPQDSNVAELPKSKRTMY